MILRDGHGLLYKLLINGHPNLDWVQIKEDLTSWTFNRSCQPGSILTLEYKSSKEMKTRFCILAR